MRRVGDSALVFGVCGGKGLATVREQCDALLGMLQLGRHRCGQRACREECEPHLTSLSVDDVQTGRGSRILAHGFAIIPVF